METSIILARYCSSVLLKKKAAALFAASGGLLQSEELEHAVCHYGLAYIKMCKRSKKTLVLIYDPNMLMQTLQQPQAQSVLSGLGYPVGQPIDAMLQCLKKRICLHRNFPHEIGFFLGYPAEDVLGFIKHKGKNCKYCGLWKVYGDVYRAQAMFEEYHWCKQQMLTHLENGGSLYNLPISLVV